MTTVAGVYAAGDIPRETHNVTWAAADGVMAAQRLTGRWFSDPGLPRER